jgi:hypothetical protein
MDCTCLPGHRDLPLVGHVDAADEVEQGGLAAARGAGQHREGALVDVEGDIAEGRHVHRPETVGFADLVQTDRMHRIP